MKISALHLKPLALSFKVPYHWAGRVDLGTATVLVTIETDEGISGYGETTSARPADGVMSLLQGISPLLVGESPFDVERLTHQARFLGAFSHHPRFANLALAGVEMALWDVIGKAVGRPVYQLLGGAYRHEVDYFGFVQGDTADELATHAAQLADAGYGVIYMKIGRGAERDVENTAAVRAAIGDRRLRLDANEAWDPLTAINMIKRLAHFDPEFIEQPTPAQSLSALKHVKESVSVPIAADQCVYSLYDVYEVCRQRAADVIVLSFHETGGLLAFKKAAAIAQAAGITICLHGQSVSGMTDLAQHQVALTLPNLADGNQIMHQLLVRDLVAAPDITPRRGKLGLYERPGLGFEIDWDAVESAEELYRRDEHYHHS
jgi:L-alanine-DL-glutamate epimerase-like enolase superfamily enzyme